MKKSLHKLLLFCFALLIIKNMQIKSRLLDAAERSDTWPDRIWSNIK